jgi:predicted amidophosphoribosyltransferase
MSEKNPAPKICPTCKQRLPYSNTVRICAECQRPILSHHKYRFETSNGKSYLVHRHCDNPYSYEPAEQTKLEEVK